MAVQLPPQPWTEGMSFVVDETGLEYTYNGEVWVSEGEPIDLSGYATKSDLESLEAELELLAKTLETGEWKVIDTPAPRPGEMWVAFDQFNVQENQIVINNEDISGKSHGWSTVHPGDFVELIDKSDQQSRSIEHDYALYLVTSVEMGNGVVTIDVDLYQGQGNCLPDEVFEVRVIDLGDSELDLDGLDNRYVKKSGETEITGTRWSLTKKNNSGTSYIMQQFDGVNHMLYQLPDPTVNGQAANKRYVDEELNKKADTHSHPYASSSHTHGGLGGSVEVKHGSATTVEYNHGYSGCNAFFAKTRRSDGYKQEASYSKYLKDLGEVKFICNSSGFSGKVGRRGLLIGSTSSTPGTYPIVVMDIWSTSEKVQYGYAYITFEGTVSWVASDTQKFGDLHSNTYWTWVGEAK